MNDFREQDPRDITVDIVDIVQRAPGAFASDARAPAALLEGALLADRYKIVRLLGQGAMGAVFEAVDESRAGLRVAVKLLVERHPNALYRLKNEFRALAETVHPNLAGLHGLGVDPLGWFVVMDLVDPSTDFLSYVRASEDGAVDEARLRSALTQLVRGIAAIHAVGKLHRDLKPRNVLVTREGRVVIVDFGLVADLTASDVRQTHEGIFVGTPAYAAPEQMLGEALGPKADLYAIGAMLFEALTGSLPFEADSPQRLLEQKLHGSALPAGTLANDVPADLDALCSALLQRDPASRPDTYEVLQQLGEQPHAQAEAPSTIPFVARESELLALCHAAARTRQVTAPVIAMVTGPSGIGKTALVARFLELMRREAGTVVFKGRCHAHEQLPFKAFDPLVDALGRYLIGLPAVEAASLMPRDVELLSRLFPTLSRVPSVSQMPAGRNSKLDKAVLRSQAFSALKELLARIADRRTLVLSFDDLQWSDDDSAELFHELLRAPGAPSCLFVCVFRENAPGASALASALRALAGVQHVDLEPLNVNASAQLARSMLGETCSAEDLRLVVNEAAGNPFLLQELSRDARACGRVSGVHDTVVARIAQLDTDARSLLELVCIAGQPLELAIAASASQVGPQALPRVLASSLLRTSLRDGREYLESNHDRIREAVVAALDSPRRAHLHEMLADVLARREPQSSELIAQHYRAAGMPLAAAPYTIRAAEQAGVTFAFKRAVNLYELAIADAHATDKRPLELALAQAYANTGRLAEAAELYEQLARAALQTEERRALAGKAMVLHLLVGSIERGTRLLDKLCKELGVMPLPRPRWLGNLAILWLYLRQLLGRRLVSLPVPTEARHTPASRLRTEFYGWATRGIMRWSIDHGVYFGFKFMLATRRYRDPEYWPAAMAWEVGLRHLGPGVSTERDDSDMARAIALAEAQDNEEILAIVLAVEGCRCLYVGKFEQSVRCFERAEQPLTARGRSMSTVFNGTRSGCYAAWMAIGEMRQIAIHSDAWLSEARALGDQWGELIVQLMGSYRFLAGDDPDAARESVAALDSPLGRTSAFCAQASWRGDVALYEGDAEAAVAACEAARRSPWYSSLRRFAYDRTWCSLFRVRAYLAAGAQQNAPAYLRIAEREARRLARERFATAPAGAAQARGTLAMLRGQELLAVRELEHAADAYAKAGVLLHAAAVRDRLGRLKQGDEGARLVVEARFAALALGVQNPERWFRSLVPGFLD